MTEVEEYSGPQSNDQEHSSSFSVETGSVRQSENNSYTGYEDKWFTSCTSSFCGY
jgi:hypothetical protein